MLRRICGWANVEVKSSDEVWKMVGVEWVVEVMRQGRLCWFSHVEWKTIEFYKVEHKNRALLCIVNENAKLIRNQLR